MSLKVNAVSAFAVYSGISGVLSKNQRRRRNKEKKKLELLSTADQPSSKILNIKKKRKLNGQDIQKMKKQKLNKLNLNGEEEVKGEEIQQFKLPNSMSSGNVFLPPIEDSVKCLNKNMKSKIVLKGLENKNDKNFKGKLKKRSEASKREVKMKTVKGPQNTELKKKKKNKLTSCNSFKVTRPPDGNRGDLKRSVKNESKKEMSNFSKLENVIVEKPSENALKKLQQTNLKKKVNTELGSSNSFNLVSTECTEHSATEDENQIKDSSGPISELLGNSSDNQSNEETLVSKIITVKESIINEEIALRKKPVHEKMIQYRKKIANRSRCSIEVGKELFEQLIAPFNSIAFFKQHWEKGPLFIPGTSATKFSSLLSTPQIDDFLRNNVVMFGKHIDITSYKYGKRETHNPDGRALPHVVWDLYKHKCSVRLLCPQAAFKNIFYLNSKLQDFFGCFVGANAYLTPPQSQGFAPHYDDIEAFVLQIEGQKNWKIYNPRTKWETLPRYSSKNFNQSELGKPLMEVTLKPGDFLYFPRGFIHQADTRNSESHSLHLTVSVYQKNSWVDLLEKALPLALSKAAKYDLDFRRGLPLQYLRQGGIAYNSVSMRKVLVKAVKDKMMKLIQYLDLDSAVDLMGVQYVTGSLPPVLNYDEASRCVLGNGLRMKNNGKVEGFIDFTGDTKIRFTTSLGQRLIKESVQTEDGKEEAEFRLYYSIDNSQEYHGEEPQFLVVPEEYVPAIKVLALNYPDFTLVKSLPLPTLNEQGRLIGDLWDRGILMTEEPLEEKDTFSDDEESEEEETNVIGNALDEGSVSEEEEGNIVYNTLDENEEEEEIEGHVNENTLDEDIDFNEQKGDDIEIDEFDGSTTDDESDDSSSVNSNENIVNAVDELYLQYDKELLPGNEVDLEELEDEEEDGDDDEDEDERW